MSLVPMILIKDSRGDWSDIFTGSIRAETYKIIPNARQDVDSYRDASGLLHRNTVEHTATSITFNLIPMYRDKMETIMKALDNWAIKPERKYNIKYYNPLTASYSEGVFYLGANHPVWEIYGTYNDTIIFKETEFKFVEY